MTPLATLLNVSTLLAAKLEQQQQRFRPGLGRPFPMAPANEN